jgi:hypothetical protein
MKLCKLGIHKWGKIKQWVNAKGNAVISERCKACGKLKKEE